VRRAKILGLAALGDDHIGIGGVAPGRFKPDGCAVEKGDSKSVKFRPFSRGSDLCCYRLGRLGERKVS